MGPASYEPGIGVFWRLISRLIEAMLTGLARGGLAVNKAYYASGITEAEKKGLIQAMWLVLPFAGGGC